MPWKISWSTGAAKFLISLEQKEAKRITAKLEEAALNPQHYFQRLAGEEEFKLRVGDYRILVLLLHDKEEVYVERAGHRKNVYKKKY